MKTCDPKIRRLGKKIMIMMAVLIVTEILFFYLPVGITRYMNLNKGTPTPFGPITSARSFDYCVDGPLEDINGFEFYAATYRRINTNQNTLTVYSLQKDNKSILTTRVFSSRDIADNSFFDLGFDPVSAKEKFCVQISSPDGSDNNAVTIWMNAMNRPVLSLNSTLPFYKALDYIQMASRMDLPLWMVMLAGWLFLAANTAIIAWIIIKAAQYRKDSQS